MCGVHTVKVIYYVIYTLCCLVGANSKGHKDKQDLYPPIWKNYGTKVYVQAMPKLLPVLCIPDISNQCTVFLFCVYNCYFLLSGHFWWGRKRRENLECVIHCLFVLCLCVNKTNFSLFIFYMSKWAPFFHASRTHLCLWYKILFHSKIALSN